MTQKLILASGSKARAQMLVAAGVAIDVQPARVDEEALKLAMKAEDAPARDIADALADLKAARISAKNPQDLVLGADQVLVMEDKIYDKPAGIEEARKHLSELRGKSHQLLSAAVIYQAGEPVWRHVGRAQLIMRPFGDAFLDEYLERVGGSVLETVGCYHLEGLGAQLFSRVQGDYFTVLGLPLLEVLGFLRARGMIKE